MVGVRAKRKGYCFYIPPINDNFPRPQYCVLDTSGRGIAGVRLSVSIGECAPVRLTTNDKGCAELSIDSTRCYNRATNSLLIEGEMITQPLVAAAECTPALFTCRQLQTRVGVSCAERIDVGTELCRYDPEEKACTRSTCSNGRRCEKFQVSCGVQFCCFCKSLC